MNKQDISKFLNVITIILLIGFIVIMIFDYQNYKPNETSFPFYTYIITRSLEFILPSIILFIVSIVLKKKWFYGINGKW